MSDKRSIPRNADPVSSASGLGTNTPPAQDGGAARRLRYLPPVLLLALLTLVVALAGDYGQSWDDPGDAQFGAASLHAYIGSPAFLHGHGDRLYYGPLYFMLSHAAVVLMQRVSPQVSGVDIRHAMNATAFALTTIPLYWLSMRLTASALVSLLTVLLFTFQPVLFGHAFINQKDTPFMLLFILAVAAGVAAVDFLRRASPAASRSRIHISHPFRPSQNEPPAPVLRRLLLAAAGLLGVALVFDLLRRGAIYQLLIHLLASAYTQAGPEWLNRHFLAVAEDAYKTPLEQYVQKVDLVYSWGSVVASLAILAALGCLAFWLLPSLRSLSSRQRGLRLLVMAAAGIPLGLCMAIRVLGGFAGILVISYALLRPRWRLIGGLTVYLSAAAIAAYLTWPFLWPAPVTHWVESLRLLLDFPPHIVLFEYIHHVSDQLPWTYLPRLLSAQLTEPAILFFAVGMVVAFIRLVDRHRTFVLLLIVLAWFLAPLLYVILARPSVYGNFRQFLFILPPFFLLAGLGIDLLFRRARGPYARALLAALLLAPGVYGIAWLHPYEYLYFNSAVGGVKGAAGRFQLDYWCVSYRPAMEYVNQHAPVGALVAVGDPVPPAGTFARPDLRVVPAPSSEDPAFALVCDEESVMDHFYPDMRTVHVVSVAGIPLAEVKQQAPDPGTPARSP